MTARDFGASWHTAMTAVRDHGRPFVDDLSRLGDPSALGLDETAFLVANAKHTTLLVTGFVDLDRPASTALDASQLHAAVRRRPHRHSAFDVPP